MEDRKLENFRIQKLYEMKKNIQDCIKKFHFISEYVLKHNSELNELYKIYGRDNVQREIKKQIEVIK